MNEKSVGKAVSEAKRFLAVAKEAQTVCLNEIGCSPSKQTGALKRASMDLTRALAEMRRPN